MGRSLDTASQVTHKKTSPSHESLPLGEEIALPLLPSFLREGPREGRLQLAISPPTTDVDTAYP